MVQDNDLEVLLVLCFARVVMKNDTYIGMSTYIFG